MRDWLICARVDLLSRLASAGSLDELVVAYLSVYEY